MSSVSGEGRIRPGSSWTRWRASVLSTANAHRCSTIAGVSVSRDRARRAVADAALALMWDPWDADDVLLVSMSAGSATSVVGVMWSSIGVDDLQSIVYADMGLTVSRTTWL